MRRDRRWTLLAAVAAWAALGLAGCAEDQVHFHDDIDLVFDFEPFNPAKPPPDELHSPYVAGAVFRMYAFRDHDRMDLWSAWAESDNPTVLDIGGRENTESMHSFDCYADAPGVAEITVYRREGSRTVWGRAQVEVLFPDEARLTFAGPLFIDAPTAEFVVDGPVSVLRDGTASFLVEYFRDGRKLSGNDVLTAQSRDPDALEVGVVQTYLFEDREWIQVTPRQAGDHVIDLFVAGRPVGVVTVRTVEPEDVAFIELRAERDKAAKEGDILAVWALGYDDAGNPIYGIEFDWDLVGNWRPESGQGDLFKYVYERREDATLEATYRGHEQRVHIHADDGWVSSTNDLGCTAGRSGRAGPGSLLLAAMAAWVLVRRRRATGA